MSKIGQILFVISVRDSLNIAHSVGHPLKRGGTQGVRGHIWNQTNCTPGRGGEVRKTYKKIVCNNLLLIVSELSNFYAG